MLTSDRTIAKAAFILSTGVDISRDMFRGKDSGRTSVNFRARGSTCQLKLAHERSTVLD